MGLKRHIKPMFDSGKWRVLRGDRVMITAGKDKGQLGTVTKVIRHPQRPRVIVEGRNLNKRFIKRTQDNPGGVVAVESPIAYSNVRPVDPVTGRPTRVTFRYTEDGGKVRVTTGKLASGSMLGRPEVLAQRRQPPALAGSKDTPLSVAQASTYDPTAFPEAWRPLLEGIHVKKERPPSTAPKPLARVAPALRHAFSPTSRRAAEARAQQRLQRQQQQRRGLCTGPFAAGPLLQETYRGETSWEE